MTTLDLQNYYVNLLIVQYAGLPKATATVDALAGMAIMPQTSVQTISFSGAPTAGTFTISFQGASSAAINWNDGATTIQTTLRGVAGLSAVTVSGSIASLQLTITLTGVTAPAPLLTVSSNTLVNAIAGTNRLLLQNGVDFLNTIEGSRIDTASLTAAVSEAVLESDMTLPLAVMNAFGLTSASPAVGVQLDTLAKYVGVTRTAFGFNTQVVLNDSDFLSFVLIAIVRNNSGSSLAAIQSLLATFFPAEILVFDYQNMQMSYLVSFNVGSQNLLQLFVTEGLLPRPMGVQLAKVIYLPSVVLVFGFRTYSTPGYNVTPFNSYANYQTSWVWISYANAISVSS